MTSPAHSWRETFALLSLTFWVIVIGCWILLQLLGLFGSHIDWNFFGPTIAGWTWDLAHVLTVVQTRL